jgi:hypothetical protein
VSVVKRWDVAELAIPHGHTTQEKFPSDLDVPSGFGLRN